MNKRAGFTLIESVIVLGLVALILSFGTVYSRRVAQVNAERAFWQSLKQNWQMSRAQVRAGKSGAVRIFYVQNGIRFKSIDIQSGARHVAQVPLPRTIRVQNFREIKMDTTGYVAPCTQRFVSSLTHQTYAMKIQLGWGGYHIETEK